MAYDGYRSPHPDSHSTSYPTSYDQTFDSRYHSSYNPPGHYPQEPYRPRSRESSQTRSDGSQQPLNDALRNAFDKSDAARTVDPDLIAEITAQVKKSVLDEIKLSGVGVTSGGQTQPHPPQQHVPHSPTSTSTSIPSRNVYTPPSPKYQDFSSHGSLSPDRLAANAMYDGSAETPLPRHGGMPTEPQAERMPPSRPAPAQRASTNGDLTPIEKMWQRLFDQNGSPTPRLGQFLRGLAIHLIEDYDPKGSLVVTPPKMLRFYEETKLSDEIYPWQVIFGKIPNLTLSKIYREMKCQHHLVQDNVTEAPHIPGLTPRGFQEWMTAMIQAYPDTEYDRLSKAVLDMPISNSDDCKERFPKELPRRLFPGSENLQAQQRCAAILSAEGVGPLRRAPSFPPPPPMGTQGRTTSNLERERSPYGAQVDSQVIESEDEEPLAVPIERERKPYSAAPGGGKVYNDDLNRGSKPEVDGHNSRPRAMSSTAQTHWVPPPNPSHPFNQRGSSHATHGNRRRSPSFSGYGTRSDPNVADIPPHYSTSNIYDTEEDNRRFARDAEIKRADWARRQAEEDAGSGSAPRRGTGFSDGYHNSPPRSVYDDDYYKSRGNGYDTQGYGGRRY